MRRRAGRTAFAAVLVFVGLWGLIAGGFAGVWDGAPHTWPMRDAVGRICALVALVAGLGLLRRETAAVSAALLAWLLLWMLAVKAPSILKAPLSAVAWESWGETAVLTAAAWTLFVEGPGARAGPRRLGGVQGVRIGQGLYALAMLAFGWAHLAYPAQTAELVPAAAPDRVAWVYLTAATYIAAGLAILRGVRVRLAAALSTVQMGLFTLLVWVPKLAAGASGAADRDELILSLALTAAGWAVADGALSRGRRRS